MHPSESPSIVQYYDIHGPIAERDRVVYLDEFGFDQIRENLSRIILGDMVIRRSAAVTAQYDRYVIELSQLGHTPADCIWELAQGSPIFLVENMFPYNVPDANHFVLFQMDPHISIDELQKYLSKWMREKNLENDDVILYQNAPLCRSVNEYPHFQIFVRRCK
ncbi:hypothetical protein KBD81_00260 [Candidatus Woesebacteria bacterium]|nr:hypothetical protein [Candidatus Woesebacteria bacterium]